VDRLRRRAAFIDRDGTINVRPAAHSYLSSQGAFRWLPGASRGLARLARAGYVLAVVSNQRGVARGLVSLDVLTAIEVRIQRDLTAHECQIDAFRYCVHGEEAGCCCRKPEPGMLLDLAHELDLDLSRSWMIGDAATDVLAGRAAGCQTVLLQEDIAARCPADGDRDASRDVRADLVASSLEHASELIVGGTTQVIC
jgi:D-glycero-D-manno-heptose 1,7-bisphosphate phosphatase